jgi:predicted transcriptional regulator
MAKVTLTFRIDEDLKCRLGETAKTQHRTSGNLVEWLIKQYLEQVEKRSTSKATEDDAWDKQIAADAEAGKLDFLLDAAQQDYDVGRLRFQ